MFIVRLSSQDHERGRGNKMNKYIFLMPYIEIWQQYVVGAVGLVYFESFTNVTVVTHLR